MSVSRRRRRFGAFLVTVLVLVLPGSLRLPASEPGKLELGDNTWQQLPLASTARFLTPGFQVTDAPVGDPNPRTRSYSALVAGAGKVFWFGGGHNSYPGNDVETFEPALLAWQQSYKPEVCPYERSAACYNIYAGWGTSVATPQGRPYTQHTYQAYTYDPIRKSIIALLSSGTWAYDVDSRRWTALAGPYAAENSFSPNGGPGLVHLMAHDLALGTVQAVINGSTGRGVYLLDSQSSRWSRRGEPPEKGWATLYSTYAPDRAAHFLHATSKWRQRWWRYEAPANRWTPLPDPPLGPDTFDYDTLNRVVVGVRHSSDVFRVVVFDPDTGQWSPVEEAEPIPSQRHGLTGTPMAWRYVPSLNAFVFVEGNRGTVAGGSTRTWVYRYRNARQGDRVPAAPAPARSPAVGTADAPREEGAPSVAPRATELVGAENPPPSGGVTGTAPSAANTDSPAQTNSTTTQEGTTTVEAPPGDGADGGGFAERCRLPGVVRCFGFDSAAQIAPFVRVGTAAPTVDTEVKASGAGSLKMTVPPRSPANTSGYFAMNFTPDSLNGSRVDLYPMQFGEGDEFYVQWRQRFSPEFLTTKYAGGGGWKQIIVGEGDRPGFTARSCTQLELVVTNGFYRGFPQMYHSCGGKDRRYEALLDRIERPGRTTPDYRLQNAVDGCLYSSARVPPCVGYKPDQWMTFQIRVKVGTWYRNDKTYHRDSEVELWVAEEGRPSRLVIRKAEYDLANQNPAARYGKVWLTPYNTGKKPSETYPEAYTWYDELIISRQRIPDPGS